MQKVLAFESMAGTFYVLKIAHRSYTIQFDEEILEQFVYESMVDAVDSFVNESGFFIYHPELAYPLDLFDLGVSDDISGWQSLY